MREILRAGLLTQGECRVGKKAEEPWAAGLDSFSNKERKVAAGAGC